MIIDPVHKDPSTTRSPNSKMYYRFISAFCIAFIIAINSPILVNGQSTDSLLYLLNNDLVKEDTNKYDLLCKIASNSADADTILKYSEQAIKLAEKLNINPAQPTVLQRNWLP